MVAKVCLQVNLAASDIRFVTYTLPHQLRVFASQVDEVLLILDIQQSRAFRFATDRFDEELRSLRQYVRGLCKQFGNARLVEVDYSTTTMAKVSAMFVEGMIAPRKACDGSAFYSYLFGLYSAAADLILHVDSDMLFGGASHTWLSEAACILADNSSVLACCPFPGPPKSDGTASIRRLTSLWNDVTFSQTCAPADVQHLAYRYNEISTRVFILDRRRFASGELKIKLIRPRWHRILRAFLMNTAPYLLLEDCMTVLMQSKGLCCVAFLGSLPGIWSLHTRHRTERFYSELPDLIRKVECGEIPDGQRGDFDMNDSMIDWSDVRRQSTRWLRLCRELNLYRSGLTERFFSRQSRRDVRSL